MSKILKNPYRKVEWSFNIEIKSGSLYADDISNIDLILTNVEKLGLNCCNLPVKINIDTPESNIVEVDAESKEDVIALIQALNTGGIKVILEPYPWVSGGTVSETLIDPTDKDTWFSSWKAMLSELINDIATPYNVYALNTASNFELIESESTRWADVFTWVKNDCGYAGLVTYRTNWWVTATWDTGPGSTTEAYENKLANSLFSDANLDFISIAAYFELNGDDAVPSVEQLKADFLSSSKFSRQQNIYQEVKNFYDVHGKPIFFGELGVPAVEYAASEPWNPDVSENESQDAQANLLQAYKDIFFLEDWFLGFSWFVINRPASSYYPVGKKSETLFAGSSWNQYKANFHTHTTRSDGSFNPDDVIDEYHAAGYKILALTDHDTLSLPWTDVGKDPEALGMIEVQGSELFSYGHHLLSWFNTTASATGTSWDDIFIAIDEVAGNGGLSCLAHPGRYGFDDDWYFRMYRAHAGTLIGFEALNQGDRYPNDREQWDRVQMLNIGIPNFLRRGKIWGFSDDDMHNYTHLFRNYQYMILPEFTKEALMRCLKTGCFYFCYEPGGSGSGSGEGKCPVISEIAVDEGLKTITIKGNHTSIEWVVDGIVSEEASNIFTYDDSMSVIRAVLTNEFGETYTQPWLLIPKLQYNWVKPF